MACWIPEDLVVFRVHRDPFYWQHVLLPGLRAFSEELQERRGGLLGLR